LGHFCLYIHDKSSNIVPDSQQNVYQATPSSRKTPLDRLDTSIRIVDEKKIIADNKDGYTLTKEQVLAKIETVQADLFQYIYERTAQVERLQAYIKELKTMP
jgi:predicted transcriptional regulator